MLCNQWEWTADRFGDYTPGPAVDPTGAAAGQGVLRGGGWGDYARWQRSAHRGASERGFRNIDIGFRPARGVAP